MELITPRHVHERLPMTSAQRRAVEKNRDTIHQLITGKDRRLALVIGPCSIHDLSSALEYGRRVRALMDDVDATFYCVMRVYIEKPRTVTGWKGVVYDPHLDGSSDIQTGIFWARALFLTLIDLGIPIATEILNPLMVPYFQDLISWGFVGARTSASQPHREIASALPFPIGFKNSPDGNIEQAVHAMVSASAPHRFPFLNLDNQLTIHESEGNPSTHVVLRGSRHQTNFDAVSIQNTLEIQESHGLKNRILIDCSHGNCQKNHLQQKEVFHSVIEQFERGNHKILGVMLESNLMEGHQYLAESPSALRYGVSITDPCLSWEETASLVGALRS